MLDGLVDLRAPEVTIMPFEIEPIDQIRHWHCYRDHDTRTHRRAGESVNVIEESGIYERSELPESDRGEWFGHNCVCCEECDDRNQDRRH